jgi:hypothetical protein
MGVAEWDAEAMKSMPEKAAKLDRKLQGLTSVAIRSCPV